VGSSEAVIAAAAKADKKVPGASCRLPGIGSNAAEITGNCGCSATTDEWGDSHRCALTDPTARSF
jgi:hypothetical protein